jgi:hypothetical protein
MLYTIIVKLYEYMLIKLFPQNYEYKVIERINSSGSVVEYSD